MRYHKAGNTLAMLMDEAIPRRPDGALNLCADCQRGMWFAGGYLTWLSNRLLALASIYQRYERIPRWCAQMKIGERREWSVYNPGYRERIRARVKELANRLGWTFRVRTWTNGRVEIWRLA